VSKHGIAVLLPRFASNLLLYPIGPGRDGPGYSPKPSCSSTEVVGKRCRNRDNEERINLLVLAYLPLTVDGDHHARCRCPCPLHFFHPSPPPPAVSSVLRISHAAAEDKAVARSAHIIDSKRCVLWQRLRGIVGINRCV
jgi:hypothetical protein